MSGYTSSDLPNWLALQKAKNAADGIGDNLLTPPPAAGRPIWDPNNLVGTSVLHDTYAGMPSPDVSPVIGAYGAHPVTAAMRANALDIASAASQFGPADMASIRAFHASPYDFNAFDLSKAGTGQGAQTYGHGVYAAESPAVSGAGGQYDLEFTAKNLGKHDLNQQEESILRSLRAGKSDMDILLEQGRMGSTFEEAQAALDRIKVAKAHLYEVSLNTDPEHFLDWDKPLSEQSQHVKDTLLDNLGVKRAPTSAATGEMVYKSLGYGQKPEEIAQRLHDAGIPGIKYLDQGSRAQGQGTSNYVIFDPKTIEILRKYGIAGLMAGGAAAATQPSNSDQ